MVRYMRKHVKTCQNMSTYIDFTMSVEERLADLEKELKEKQQSLDDTQKRLDEVEKKVRSLS